MDLVHSFRKGVCHQCNGMTFASLILSENILVSNDKSIISMIFFIKDKLILFQCFEVDLYTFFFSYQIERVWVSFHTVLLNLFHMLVIFMANLETTLVLELLNPSTII